MKIKKIKDERLGELIFPENDQVISEHIKIHGTWEQAEQSWIEKNVFPGSVVYNLGSNIGYHSIFSSMVQGGDGRVVSIEASQELCKLIKINCESRSITNIEIFNVAITDHVGEELIYFSENNCGDNRVANSLAGEKNEKVQSVTINELIRLVGEYPDIIIMDIQGWETQVLASIELKNKKIKCMFEFTPSFIEQMGFDIKKEIDSVLYSGWTIKDLSGNPVDLYEIYNQYLVDPTPHNFFMNLVAER